MYNLYPFLLLSYIFRLHTSANFNFCRHPKSDKILGIFFIFFIIIVITIIVMWYNSILKNITKSFACVLKCSRYDLVSCENYVPTIYGIRLQQN